MAWIEKFFVSQRDSTIRGINRKCFRFACAAESAGNEQIVARLGRRRAIPSGLVSTNPVTLAEIAIGPGVLLVSPPTMLTSKPIRSPAQAAIKLFHPCDVGLFRKHQSNQRKLRHGGRRGKIAQRTHHCLPSDIKRVRSRVKNARLRQRNRS